MYKSIVVQGLYCVKRDRFILDDVNFEVDKGNFVAIMGKSGCGKSTLIRILSGVESFSGYVAINGQFLETDSRLTSNIRVRTVLSLRDAVFVGSTVWEELSISLLNIGMGEEEIEKKVNRISSLLLLDDVLTKKILDLSVSVRCKVLIAAALVVNPDILLMDDCFRFLTVFDKNLVIKVLKLYKKERKLTFLLCTNCGADVVDFDKVLVINSGKVFYNNTPAKVFRNREHLIKLGIKIPIAVDLSIKLREKEVVKNIFLDSGKLVDRIWK